MADSFSAYSWDVLSDSVAVKRMDKSSFLHGGTGIPKEVAPFFDLPDEGLTESKSITLEVDGSKYDAHIEMDATLARFRLFWKSDLSEVIRQRFPQCHELYISKRFRKGVRTIYS
jgi:5-methylcytosine-specific restriction enzyme A